MSVANTFDENIQMGASLGSYHVPSGMTVACDYILHSDMVAVVPGSLRMLEEFKMDNKKADHRPLGVSVVVQTGKAVPVARRRKARYDRQAVKQAATSDDPELRMQALGFANHLRAMPAIPVNCEPSSHRHLLASYILDGLECHYPLPRRVKREEWLSQATFKICYLQSLEQQ